MKTLVYLIAGMLALHGLVHLMGFVAYWPIATVAELPYKTALAGGRWEVGPSGMRVFAVLWLLTSLGFLLGAAGLAARSDWWRPVLLPTLALSFAIIGLDWAPAFRGAVVNAVALFLVALTYIMKGALPQ